MSDPLDRLVRRLSRVTTTALEGAVRDGMSPLAALRLGAATAAACLVNAGFSLLSGREVEAGAHSITTEFKSAFLKFVRLARTKDPRDEASQPTDTRH